VLVQPETVGILSKSPEVSAMAAVAQQVLNGARELRRALAGHSQLLIDLLA